MIRFILKSILISILAAIVVYLILWIGRLISPEIEPVWSKLRGHVLDSLKGSGSPVAETTAPPTARAA